jgi:hypothetical protein
MTINPEPSTITTMACLTLLPPARLRTHIQ